MEGILEPNRKGREERKGDFIPQSSQREFWS